MVVAEDVSCVRSNDVIDVITLAALCALCQPRKRRNVNDIARLFDIGS